MGLSQCSVSAVLCCVTEILPYSQHASSSETLSLLSIASGIGFIATALWQRTLQRRKECPCSCTATVHVGCALRCESFLRCLYIEHMKRCGIVGIKWEYLPEKGTIWLSFCQSVECSEARDLSLVTPVYPLLLATWLNTKFLNCKCFWSNDLVVC